MPDWGLSLGALARGQSLADILAQRKLEALAAADRAEKIRQFNVGAEARARGLDITARGQALNEQLRRDALNAAQDQREFGRANTLYQETPRGTVLSPESAALHAKFGFPVNEEATLPSLQSAGGSALPGTVAGPETLTQTMPSPSAATGRILSTGGPKEYLAQQAFAEKRAAQTQAEQARHDNELARASDAQERAAETARHNRAMEGLGAITAQTGRIAAESAATARTDKAAVAEEKKATQRAALRTSADEVLRTVDELMTPEGTLTPGGSKRFGLSSYLPEVLQGGQARNAEAAVKRLVSQLSLGALTELRRLSATGGALGNVSNQDMTLLQNSATILSRPNVTPEAAAKELAHVRAVYTKIKLANSPDLGATWGNP